MTSFIARAWRCPLFSEIREQCEPVVAQLRLLRHDHHRLKKCVHRRFQHCECFQITREIAALEERRRLPGRLLQGIEQGPLGRLLQVLGRGPGVGLPLVPRLFEDIDDALVGRSKALGLGERLERLDRLELSRNDIQPRRVLAEDGVDLER
jgi:hypothetical protein